MYYILIIEKSQYVGNFEKKYKKYLQIKKNVVTLQYK